MGRADLQKCIKQINNDIFLKNEFDSTLLMQVYGEILTIEDLLTTDFIYDLFMNMLLINNVNLTPALKVLYNNIWEMLCIQLNLGNTASIPVEHKVDTKVSITDTNKELFPDTILKDPGKDYLDKNGTVITDFTSLWLKAFSNYLNDHKDLLDFDDKTYKYSRITLKDNISVPEHSFIIKLLFDKTGNAVRFIEPPREIGEVEGKDIDSLFTGFLADLDNFKLED